MAWLHRAGLAGLLLAAYLWAGTPLRTAWIAHGAAPLLEWVADASKYEGALSVRPEAQSLRLSADTAPTLGHSAPGGIRFLLPAGALILIAPCRPRLGAFLAGHLALGGLTLGLLAAGIEGVPGGIEAAQFVRAYAVDVYSLSVPALAVARRHASPPLIDA